MAYQTPAQQKRDFKAKQSYVCRKCDVSHRVNSQIGKKHIQYKRGY